MVKFSKKLGKLVITMLITLCTFASTLPVNAETVSISPKNDQYTAILYMKDGYVGWGPRFGHIRVDGKTAYCIDASTLVSESTDAYRLVEENNELAVKLAYYGYGYGNQNSEEWYIATQVAIWKSISKGINDYQLHIGGEIIKNGVNSYISGGENIKPRIDGMVTTIINHVNNNDPMNRTDLTEQPFTYTAGNNYQDVITVGFLTPPEYPITVNLEKSSTNQEVTDNNDCYSLEGAVYNFFYDEACTKKAGSITTDSKGKGTTTITVPADTKWLYYKEMIAPKGYLITEFNPQTDWFYTDETAKTIYPKDSPDNDPFGIEITKISEDNLANPEPLAGAEFTVKYYANRYEDVNSLPEQADRTWILKTVLDSDGVYRCGFRERYKAGGDPFFLDPDVNEPVLYAGTLTIEETKAPAGYTTENRTMATINNHMEIVKYGDVVLFHIEADKRNNVTVITGNQYEVEEKPERGGLKIQKHDTETDTVQGDADLTATYEIVNNNDVDRAMRDADGSQIASAVAGGVFDYTITTDANGYWESPAAFLQIGNYTIREITAPEGYLISADRGNKYSTSAEFKITKDGMTDLTGTLGDDVIHGGFELQKHDSETGTRSQGDTNLQTTFDIYNISKAPVEYDGKIIAVGDKVTTVSTDESGNYCSSDEEFSYGTYKVVEAKAPNGYTSEGKTEATFSIRENKKIVQLVYTNFEGRVIEDPTVSNGIENRVDYGTFSIHKVYTTQEGSSWTNGEAGATFIAVLERYITATGKNGEYTREDVIKAYEQRETANVVDGCGNPQIGYTNHEWDILTTDDNGDATSRDLAYGKYVIAQYGSANDDLMVVESTAIFEVKNDKQPEEKFEATNKSEPYIPSILKKDSLTGELVTLNSAEFKVFQLTDVEGNEVNEYVVQKVGNNKYSTYRTCSDTETSLPKGTFYVSDGTKGIVTLPLKLYPGTYRIEEVENSSDHKNGTPEGYVTMDPVVIKVGSDSIYRVGDDEDGDRVIAYEAQNDRILGKLTVIKTLEDYKADTTLINRNDLSGFEFELRAEEDIKDTATGETITKKGEIAKNVDGVEIGAFSTDKEGKVVVNSIPFGKYTLKESKVVSGTVLNEETFHIEFKQKVTGGLLGIGSYLDSDADSYEKDENGMPIIAVEQKVENKTTKVVIEKTDVAGDELPGAEMSVTDKDGNVVDHWISGETGHKIEGLEVGEYTLHENLAPIGYAKASSLTFKVNEKGVETTETMIDTVVSVSKEDQGGKELPGAEIVITDEDGNEIDRWISTDTPHVVNGVESGKTYMMTETASPDGYYYSETGTFTVNGTEDQLITMTDNVIRYLIAKVDDVHGTPVAGAKLSLTDITDEENPVEVELPNEGVTTEKPFVLDGQLIAEHTYVLEEIETPFGFETAEPVEFTVPKFGSDETTTISMVDERKVMYVSAIKVDAADHSKKLKNAEITLFTADGKVAKDINGKECVAMTDGNGIITWEIKYDGNGSTDSGYYVQETKAPTGYRMNKDKFKVILSEDYNFAKDNPVQIKVNDQALPSVDTGIESPVVPFATAGISAMIAAGVFFYVRRRNAK